MSRWNDPITDRTQADIINRTQKAFFNVADWLRIHENTDQARVIVEVLAGIDIDLIPLDAPTIYSFPTVTEINYLIENIEVLRVAAALPGSAGLVDLFDDYQAGAGAIAPDYNAVNNWEQNLLLVHDLLVHAVDYLVYAGVAQAGQTRSWQNRYRRWAFVPAAASPARRVRAGLATAGAGLQRNNSYRRYA